MKPVGIDLGCGPNRVHGCFGVDIDLGLRPNIVGDIDKCSLPFVSTSVDYILCWDVLEHLHNPVHFMNECHRVLRVGGELHIRVPFGGSYWAMVDPTHIRPYYPESFFYFTVDAPASYSFIDKWEISELKCVRHAHEFKYLVRNVFPFASTLSRFILGMYDQIDVKMRPLKVP